MNDMKNILEKSSNKLVSTIEFISKHRIVITILVISAAVIIAVLQAQTYLNPERNEEKYLEVKSTISIREIDQEIIDKLIKTQEDRENIAESNFVDDRTNPFAE
jgi:hypothetical protein